MLLVPVFGRSGGGGGVVSRTRSGTSASITGKGDTCSTLSSITGKVDPTITRVITDTGEGAAGIPIAGEGHTAGTGAVSPITGKVDPWSLLLAVSGKVDTGSLLLAVAGKVDAGDVAMASGPGPCYPDDLDIAARDPAE